MNYFSYSYAVSHHLSQQLPSIYILERNKLAKFNSAEELLALRPKAESKHSPIIDRSTRDILSPIDQMVKTYKFKRVKNSACGWEVDYSDQKEDIPGQLDLTED